MWNSLVLWDKERNAWFFTDARELEPSLAGEKAEGKSRGWEGKTGHSDIAGTLCWTAQEA